MSDERTSLPLLYLRWVPVERSVGASDLGVGEATSEDSSDHSANSMHAKGVESIVITLRGGVRNRLREEREESGGEERRGVEFSRGGTYQVVLELDASEADRTSDDSHHKRSGRVHVARGRSDDHQSSYSTTAKECQRSR